MVQILKLGEERYATSSRALLEHVFSGNAGYIDAGNNGGNLFVRVDRKEGEISRWTHS